MWPTSYEIDIPKILLPASADLVDRLRTPSLQPPYAELLRVVHSVCSKLHTFYYYYCRLCTPQSLVDW